MVGKELCYAFVHQLIYALVELLLLHGISVFNILEHFRRKARKSLEMQLFASREGVANLKIASIRKAYNIACKRFIDSLLFLRHEAGGCGETHLLSFADMFVIGVALEFSGADFEECDATAVVGVHVGMNLKAEARKFLFERIHHSFQRAYRSRGGGNLNEAFEELLYAKGVECRTEEHGCKIALKIFLFGERVIHAFDEVKIHTQLIGILLAYQFGNLRVIDVCKLNRFGDGLLVGRIEVERLLEYVVYALKSLSHIDRP